MRHWRKNMASTPSSPTAPVATPSTPRQLADLLGEVAVRGHAISPIGGGTKLAYGNPFNRETVFLSTKSLDRILAYEPDDMTISVEAGATISSIWRELDARGQTIPIDVPAPGSETIGGLIATGLCGPRRYGSGSLRDALIGIQVAYPDATLGNAGGMVVKNVSGFDLMRMHLGALGTLGVVVSANFKVVPAARGEATVLIERERLEQLEGDRLAVGAGRIRPVAYEAHRVGDRWHELVRIEGRPSTVDQMARELADRLGGATALPTDDSKAHWRDYIADEAFPSAETALVVQVRGRPSESSYTLRATLDVMESAGLSLDDIRISLGLGTVRVAANLDDGGLDGAIESIRALRSGLSVLILKAPAALYRTTDAFGTPESTLELMRQLKRQFDPRSVLNPGRVIPEL
jgi:glycolate oxidase FAD binding subunit